MTLNDAPSGERARIGFFGVRNAGKSSLVNAVTGQELAVVSGTAGTTTDLVVKNMELLPAGPVTIVDTPGIDDTGELGSMRVAKARQALRSCDVAVLVVDATRGMQQADRELVALFAEHGVPCVVAWNKADVTKGSDPTVTLVRVSAKTGEGVRELKERIAHAARGTRTSRRIVADLFEPGDVVVLVMPIDGSAPKDRIILPQQMVLRDILDAHACALACQPGELAAVLGSLAEPPRLVITDSQAFEQVAAVVPRGVALTSFSILMMRYKGELAGSARAAATLATLRDGDHVLVSEGCTHHRQCGDIGTVKMPEWIRAHAGAEPEFAFTSGGEFPDDLAGVSCVVHCGGCMLNEREIAHRMGVARAQGVPFVNYGMAIAHMHGILDRALEPLA